MPPAELTSVDSVSVSCGKSPVASVRRSEWPGSITADVGKISICSSVGTPGVSATCDACVYGCHGSITCERAYTEQSATVERQRVGVSARSDATSVPAVIWLEAPLGSTSEMVAMICVSLTFELIQMSALIGPESAYGAVKGGVVNVAASASLGELSFSQFQPATSPAVHCVVEREQVPFSGIHGNVAVVSAASVTGASDPAYSE